MSIGVMLDQGTHMFCSEEIIGISPDNPTVRIFGTEFSLMVLLVGSKPTIHFVEDSIQALLTFLTIPAFKLSDRQIGFIMKHIAMHKMRH